MPTRRVREHLSRQAVAASPRQLVCKPRQDARFCNIRVLEAAHFLDAVVGGVDFAGACLGALAHVFGQVAEAVGVVFGNQLAVGALDRALVGVAVDAEHCVRVRPLRRTLRRHVAAAGAIGVAVAARAAGVPGVALHRHQRHQLHVADAQRIRQLTQDRHLLRRRIALGQHGLDHHVEHREGVVAAQTHPVAQRSDGRADVELRLLADVEAGHRLPALLGVQAHARHQPFGDRDLLLRHAAVGLRHRAEQGEQRADEATGFRRGALALAVAQVVEHEADHRAGDGAGQVADQQAEEGEPQRVGVAHGAACGACALYQRASASSSASLTGPIAARITGMLRRPSRYCFSASRR